MGMSATKDKWLQTEYLLFYVFLLLKPFYIRKSGSVQIADIFFASSFLIWLIQGVRNQYLIGRVRHEWKLVCFVILACLVNVIYRIKTGEVSFIMSSLYLCYSLAIVLVFGSCKEDKSFLIPVKKICLFNLILQTVFLVTGLGRYRFEHRYVGTFNDPNQLAFFTMASMMLVQLIEDSIKKESRLVLLPVVPGILLVLWSKSVGITLGLIVWLCWSAICVVRRWGKENKAAGKNRVLFYGLSAASVVIVLSVMVLFGYYSDNYNLIIRIVEKLSRLAEGGVLSLCRERGIDRLWLYPKYLLCGAGEGAYDRFGQSELVGIEIHSSILGLWFCYGIVPLMLLISWVKDKTKAIPFEAIGMYLALLAESMFLVNYRQPFFWMILVLADGLRKK